MEPPTTPPWTLAIAMQKGGVGKTTTTAALGAAWAARGLRVLLVDFDPQASLTEAVGSAADAVAVPLASVMQQYVQTGIWPDVDLPLLTHPGVAGVAGLDLVPGHRDLAFGEVTWRHADAREQAQDSQLLRGFLHRYLPPAPAPYDVILIDSPPALGLLTVNVLAAAHALLIPVVPEAVALHGFGRLAHTLRDMRHFGINRRLTVAGVLPCRVRYSGRRALRQHTASLEGIATIAAYLRAPLFPGVPDAAVVLESAAASLPITVYAPDSRPALAYRAVADALLNQKESHVQQQQYRPDPQGLAVDGAGRSRVYGPAGAGGGSPGGAALAPGPD